MSILDSIPIDSRFIFSAPLEEIFRDKDTGLPLRNGYIEFYRDTARDETKDVYIQTGTPGAYTATSIGSRVDLDQSGAMSYLGANVTILYFPYLSNTVNSTDIDRYFIRVFSSEGVPQFTREGWPFGLSEESTGDGNFINYIENGQFKIHRNLLPTSSDSGKASPGVNYIDFGNWQYRIPNVTTTNDHFSFPRFGSPIDIPPSNPRYFLRTECVTPGVGDTHKVLAWLNRDCNFYASDSNFLTFSFWAENNLTGPITVPFSVFKNFDGIGQGEQTLLFTFLITPGWNQYIVSFVMGKNTGKIIAPGDVDYLYLGFSLPTDQPHNINWTNFILRDGSYASLTYPEKTITQYQRDTLPAPLPASDGSDIGKTIILSSHGFKFGGIQVGDHKLTWNPSPDVGWIYLPSDGLTISKYPGVGINFSGEKFRALYGVLQPNPATVIQGGIKNPDPNVDFDTGLFIVIPPMVGRVFGAAGQGTGLTNRTAGSTFGTENESLNGNQNGPHTHTMDPNNAATTTLSTNTTSGSVVGCQPGQTVTGSSGLGAPHNNMQPTVFMYLMLFHGGDDIATD